MELVTPHGLEWRTVRSQAAHHCKSYTAPDNKPTQAHSMKIRENPGLIAFLLISTRQITLFL